MKLSVLRNLTRTLHIINSPSRLAFSSRLPLRLYSSDSTDPPPPDSESNSFTEHKSNDASLDVSNKELKKLIDMYYGGDPDVIPSIFEAILKRKLAGKYEREDDEMMQELMQGRPSNCFGDEEFNSDSDELSDTDDEEESD